MKGTSTRTLLAIVLIPLLLLVFHGSGWAGFARVANFMFDDRGNLVQLRYLKKKEFTVGRGFPLAEYNEGLAVVASDDTELARLIPTGTDSVDILWAYPLDSRRVVCNARTRRRGKSGLDGLVWNTATNAVTWLSGDGTSEWGEVAAVHPRLPLSITVPSGKKGIILHDRSSNSTTMLFTEYRTVCPRFSPDGSHYAFFAQSMTFDRSLLIVQSTEGGNPAIYEFSQQKGEKVPPFGRSLAWSPSGKLLAGLASHANGQYLHLWNQHGKLLSSHRLSFCPGPEWAPLWSPNESEILLFERELMPGEKAKDLMPYEMHRVQVR